MSLHIDVNRQPVTDPRWQPWVEENDLTECFDLAPVDESLTRWVGKFYVRGRWDVVTREVTTTPADPSWLVEVTS